MVMRNLNELIGRNGLINDYLVQVPHRQFIPKGLVSLSAGGKNLKFLGCEINKIAAGSIGFNYQHALNATVGEYIERLLSSIPDQDDIIFGAYDELIEKKFPLIHPNTFNYYAPWQYDVPEFTLTKFTTSDKVNWIKGYNYLSGQTVYLPSFLIYLSSIQDRMTKRFFLGTSTGQAAGISTQDALERGFLEIVERHAFSKFWYTQNYNKLISYTPQIILNSYPDENINRLFNNKSVHIKIFDLGESSPTEAIAVFIFFYYKNKLFYTLGAAANFSKKKAITKAALEAYQGVGYAIHLFNKCKWGQDFDIIIPSLNRFKDHFNFYNYFPQLRLKSPVLQSALNEKSSSTELVHFNGKMENFQKSELKNQRDIQNIFYVDLSSKNKFQLPFRAVKVVMPEFALLTGSHNHPFLGNKIFSEEKNLFLNLPHCFP
jgi:ribosomal protein S12 methylthiotransferase accessory factor